MSERKNGTREKALLDNLSEASSLEKTKNKN
jgi:hypothetical protein